VIQRMVRPSHH